MFLTMLKSRYQSGKKNEIVDFLRGIAVFLGAIGHFYYIMWQPTGHQLQPSYPVAVFLFNITYGIAIFFPISGFLITSILLKSVEKGVLKFQKINVLGFYIFRFARIFPGLLVLCCLNLLLNAINYPGFQIHAPLTWQTIIAYVCTLRANVLFNQDFYHLFSWGVLWSLAIEEVFYIFYPLICAFFRYFYVIFIVLFSIVLYGLWYRSQAASAFVVLRSYWGCFDQIALGCIAAFGVHMNCFSRTRRRFWISGLILLTIIFCLTLWISNYVYGPTLIGLSVSMMLFGLIPSFSTDKNNIKLRLSQKIKQLVMLPMCMLGVLSYEFYLFHALLFLLLKPLVTIIALKTGWTWNVSLLCLCVEMIILIKLSSALFFYGFNPLRKKIIQIGLNLYSLWVDKVDTVDAEQKKISAV